MKFELRFLGEISFHSSIEECESLIFEHYPKAISKPEGRREKLTSDDDLERLQPLEYQTYGIHVAVVARVFE